MVKTYEERPSKLLGIDDVYTSYCLDEACAYALKRIEKGDEPDFSVFEESRKHYSSFSEMYKHIVWFR